MQANLPQLPDFVRLAARIGITEVYMQRLVYFGGGEMLAENATMKADQSLHAALELQQAGMIRECEQLATELFRDHRPDHSRPGGRWGVWDERKDRGYGLPGV